ncbi:hypothetical protein, partial [Mycobacterium sp.]|uniref:hypothetical protein n=1 Tax=Mycobacterium sp. TaxID=1785 RepID=UPI003C76BFB5
MPPAGGGDCVGAAADDEGVAGAGGGTGLALFEALHAASESVVAPASASIPNRIVRGVNGLAEFM